MAIDIINTPKEEENACQMREGCKELWDAAEEWLHELVLPKRSRPRRRSAAPTSLRDFVVESKIKGESEEYGFDVFAQEVFEIVDKITIEIEKRFGTRNITIMQGITSLCQIPLYFLNEEILTALFQVSISNV